jgi:hypothetical protein
MTPEEEHKTTDDWFSNLPAEIEESYLFLRENVKKIQTFDLLSYIAYYNHLHDSEQYTDFRGDKNFFVPEVLALLCLKDAFVTQSTVSKREYIPLMIDIQKNILNYCGRIDALEIKKQPKRRGEDAMLDIANLLAREAKQIRNPGLPDHHLIFVEKLFEPIKEEVKSALGFSISDSVEIRKKLPDMINRKYRNAFDKAMDIAGKHSTEIIKYRKTKVVGLESAFTKEQLEEYSQYSDKRIKLGLKDHFLNEMYYTFSSVYTFTAEELADFTKIELAVVKSFLKVLSCGFPSLKEEDKIYEPVTILKTKPIIQHEERYLIPSFSLLIWAVEDVVESTINKNQKNSDKYKDIKHNFLLNQGLLYFKKLLPTATVLQPNLFYSVNGDRCETDGLIIYDQVLFIIEAKGHRITPRAKKGFTDRTEKHMEEIVQDSYEQGIRTLKYIEDNEVAEFKTKTGDQILITRKDYDEVIIVSLTLEQVGNLSMLIKATNDIGYFQEGHFPWIISIYDLLVFTDLIENPFLFILYIKRRKTFLSHKMLSIYEELDLLSYFLANGLYMEHTLKEAEEKNVSWIEFMPETDQINDYYMYKFGHKAKFTEKPKAFISREFNNFLIQLDQSKMPHRVRMALLILEFNSKSIKQLMDYVRITKKAFSKDKGIHDCSIYTDSLGGIGVTFMTGLNREELDFKLHRYCTYKVHQLNSNVWVGLGDGLVDKNKFKFHSMYFATPFNTIKT